jgi:hypothetical protein
MNGTVKGTIVFSRERLFTSDRNVRNVHRSGTQPQTFKASQRPNPFNVFHAWHWKINRRQRDQFAIDPPTALGNNRHHAELNPATMRQPLAPPPGPDHRPAQLNGKQTKLWIDLIIFAKSKLPSRCIAIGCPSAWIAFSGTRCADLRQKCAPQPSLVWSLARAYSGGIGGSQRGS